MVVTHQSSWRRSAVFAIIYLIVSGMIIFPLFALGPVKSETVTTSVTATVAETEKDVEKFDVGNAIMGYMVWGYKGAFATGLIGAEGAYCKAELEIDGAKVALTPPLAICQELQPGQVVEIKKLTKTTLYRGGKTKQLISYSW